jgi:hypothetical protein
VARDRLFRGASHYSIFVDEVRGYDVLKSSWEMWLSLTRAVWLALDRRQRRFLLISLGVFVFVAASRSVSPFLLKYSIDSAQLLDSMYLLLAGSNALVFFLSLSVEERVRGSPPPAVQAATGRRFPCLLDHGWAEYRAARRMEDR